MYKYLLLVLPSGLYFYYKFVKEKEKKEIQKKTLSKINKIKEDLIYNITQFKLNLDKLNKTLDDYNFGMNK
jgi:DNA-binding transcriptional regulator YhcF (GntR family)